MMGLLILDVFINGIDLRLSKGKYAITFLPFESRLCKVIIIDLNIDLMIGICHATFLCAEPTALFFYQNKFLQRVETRCYKIKSRLRL